MKSQIFNGARFRATFSQHLHSRGRQLSMYAFIILAACVFITLMPALLFGFDFYTHPYNLSPGSPDPIWGMELDWLPYVLIFSAAIVGSMAFADMSGKERRITTLTLPASMFEKWLTWFVIYFVGVVVIFLLCAWVADMLRVVLFHLFGQDGDKAMLLPVGRLLRLSNSAWDGSAAATREAVAGWSSSLMVLAVFFLGSAYFPKRPLAKTLCLLIAIAVSGLLLYQSGMKLAGVSEVTQPRFELSEWGGVVLGGTLKGCVCVFLLWLSYLRLRQSETVNRW